MGKGISYRDPVSYELATVAVAVFDNKSAKGLLARYGYRGAAPPTTPLQLTMNLLRAEGLLDDERTLRDYRF